MISLLAIPLVLEDRNTYSRNLETN